MSTAWLTLRSAPPTETLKREIDPVAEAVRGWSARPIEGRPSGGFDHAPFDPEAAESAIALDAPRGRELLRVEVALYRGSPRESSGPTVGPHPGARGKILLLRRQTEDAVEVFEAIHLREPSEPGTLSDLSAAYLTRAAEEGAPGDLVRALEMSERALVLDSSSPEARFNRALALEALYLVPAAITAWEEYLEADKNSGWADEAEQRLKDLGLATGRLAPDEEGGLPPAASGDPRETESRDQMEEGIALYEQYRLADAVDRLTAARAGLGALDSRLTPWADYYLALCRYQEADYDQALARIARVVDAAVEQDGPDAEVRGRSLQLAGLIHNIEGRHGEGLAAYRLAAQALERSPNRHAWVGVQSSLAAGHEHLGDPRTAWRHRYAALAEASTLDAKGRVRLYAEPTSAVLGAGLPLAARHFADAMVRAAEEAADPGFSIAAYRRRAEVWEVLEDRDRALSDLNRALKESAAIGNRTLASITRADILATRGELEVDRDPVGSMAGLDEALAIYRATDNRSGEPRVLRTRARASRALGDLQAAQRDLDQALTVLEEQHRGVEGIELRAKFFREARPVFDEMAALALERGELREALAAAERSHMAGGLDLWGGRNGPPVETSPAPALEEDSARVPPGVALVEYYALRDRLLIGLIRHDGVWVEQAGIGVADLAHRTRAFRRKLVIGADRTSVQETAAELFEWLVGPVRDRLRAGDDLVVVPDGPLHAVPFAALWDAETGRYLIEEHQVVMSPSAAYALGTGRGSEAPRTASRVLVVAAPEPDPALPDLGRLPGARREAREIASLFPEVTVLSGAEATGERLLAEARRHEILHFAGHAVANPENPLLSFLAMTPTAGPGTGALFARTLAEQHLDGARLVVLAACRSADAGGPDGSAGLSSLSRAFLAAGVPLVIGSLWEAEDSATARLFEHFYRELRRGVPAPAALRAAQLVLSSTDADDTHSPFAWAAFRVEGSIIDSAGQN